MLLLKQEHTVWKKFNKFVHNIFKVQLVTKLWKQMERSASSSLHAVTSRIIQPMQKFCFCMRLKNGVIIISILAFVIGIGFLVMGTEMASEITVNQAIAVGCQITGFIFLIWFLILLLLQTMQLKFPIKCSIVVGYILSSWLLLVFVGFICLLFLKEKHDDLSHVIILANLGSAFGILFTLYSVWVLKSYANSLEGRNTTEPTTRRPVEELPDQEIVMGQSKVILVNRVSFSLDNQLPVDNSRTKSYLVGPEDSKGSVREVISEGSAIHGSKTFIHPLDTFCLKEDEPPNIEDAECNCNSPVPSYTSRSQQTSPTPSYQTLKSLDIPLTTINRHQTL